jgi:hypothetical protein
MPAWPRTVNSKLRLSPRNPLTITNRSFCHKQNGDSSLNITTPFINQLFVAFLDTIEVWLLYAIVSVEGVHMAVGVKTQYVDKWFGLTPFVLGPLPNPLQLQLEGESSLLQPIDGDADLHVGSFFKNVHFLVGSFECLLHTPMTMLEEPQNDFGSNRMRNPLRACRHRPLSKSDTC